MADGALRSDVLAVLGREGVDVEQLPADRYRLSKGDALLTVRIQATVSRTTCGKLERRFGIYIAKFFPPLKLAPVDLPKVVPHTPKAT